MRESLNCFLIGFGTGIAMLILAIIFNDMLFVKMSAALSIVVWLFILITSRRRESEKK